MYILLLGILLILLKYFDVAPVAAWSWWWVVLPPACLTLAWWMWADASGYTKRKAMEKMDKRKRDRVNKQREALGIGPRRRR